MLCSVSAGKSGSNWLERLRSNKGFPTVENLDLDHFLNTQTLDTTSESTPDSIQFSHRRVANNQGPPSLSPRENGDRGLYGLVTNVLSELFYMGGSVENSKLSGKKFPRKQTTPKNCSISSSNTANNRNIDEKSPDIFLKEENFPSSNSDNGLKGNEFKGEDNVGCGNVEEVDNEEEKKGEKELVGYSRSEVTVIDTSCEVWKSDKFVFRRKNVWKVRERKVKLRSFGRKKRKQGNDNNGGSYGIVLGNKKSKVSGPEEFELSAKEGQNCRDDSRDEISINALGNLKNTKERGRINSPDNRSQEPKNRSAGQSGGKRGSSVIVIKGIPTKKKMKQNLPRIVQ